MKTISTIILLIVPIALLAAPLQPGIGINKETEECTKFWGGDEFTEYVLPEGWEEFYPVGEGNQQVIITEFGHCLFDSSKVGRGESCCKQMGLTYVDDPGIVDTEAGTGLQSAISIWLHDTMPWFLGLLAILVLSALLSRRRRR